MITSQSWIYTIAYVRLLPILSNCNAECDFFMSCCYGELAADTNVSVVHSCSTVRCGMTILRGWCTCLHTEIPVVRVMHVAIAVD